jgi:hypothetical protein
MTGFSLGARQRVFERWSVGLTAGYDMAEYHATQFGISASRSDNYYSLRLGVDYQISERWSSGAFYSYRRNSSNVGYGYDNNQFGVQASWRF